MFLPFLARKSGAKARFGEPFQFKKSGTKPSRDDLSQMTDEAMYILAAMLPQNRRGHYSDLESATRDTIVPL
jgi:hypothetical protein